MITHKNNFNICLALIFSVVLAACSSGGSDGDSDKSSSAPEAPASVTASVSGDSVSLSWDEVSAATSYKVYRDGNLLNSVTNTSFSESGLAYGTYFYEVTSVNGSGESSNKASVSVDVHEVAPAAPSDLSYTVNVDSVSLSWSTVSGASSYKVYRDGGLVESVSTNSFSEGELDDGTYLYEVTSVNDYGESGSKASISVTIDTTPPSAPTSLTASTDGDSVSLSWSAVSRASSYKVYRDGSLLGEVSTNSFDDSGLEGGTYFYEVSSINEFGESADKASITVFLSSEPLYAYQWHLQNTGQSSFASTAGTGGEDINHSGAMALGVTGSGVRVNVIDTGLELGHPDLQANIVAGGSYDYVGDDDDPTNNADANGDHGTSVAGLIAAVGNNGIGVSGVAGDAQLQGYNYLLSNQSDVNYMLAHGFDTKLEDTDIFNKSLGSDRTVDYPIASYKLDTLSCLTTGGSFDLSSGSSCESALRSGLGAIYVKSAGNSFATSDGDDFCDDLGLTCWNGNMEPEQTYPYQVVVGALNANGEKSSYSTAGSSIWISAPGGEYGYDYNYLDSELRQYGYTYTASDSTAAIWQPAMVTVDQVGCDRGYTTARVDFGISGVPAIGLTSFHEDDDLNHNCEYTSTFNGTSSAAPVVSGVVALMLEANPDLSWRDVKHILARSARQVDSDAAALDVPAVVCANSSCSSYESSSSISFTARDAWITNAAGYKYHTWYGFGAVNAGAAVAMAQSYSSPLDDWQKSSYSHQSVSASIPDATGAAASATLNVADSLTIESVQLELGITHTAIGQLAVVLYSPEGTRSVVLTPYNQFGEDDDFSSTLLSNAFYGENSQGDWLLEIYDLSENESGTLDTATISIYGY